MLIAAGGRFDLVHLVMLDYRERLAAELDRDPERVDEWRPLGHGGNGTPLHEAADHCNGDMGALLLERGAGVEATDSDGRTALMRAADQCRDEPDRDGPDSSRIIRVLVEAGAAIDLGTAVILGEVEKARALIESDPQLVNQRRRGWTPLDLAVSIGRPEIERLLREAGAGFAQNLEAMLGEAPPGHGVHEVLAQSPATKTAAGYIELKPSPSLDIRDGITLAAWVYRLGEGGTVIGKWYQRGSWSYVLHLPRDGFHLRWEDRTQTNIRGFTLPYLEWAHYAGTYDGSRMRVYVNGELVAERAVAGKRINSKDNPVLDRRQRLPRPHPRSNRRRRDLERRANAGADPAVDAQRTQRRRAGPGGLAPDGRRTRRGTGPPHGNHGSLQGEAVLHSTDVPGDGRHAPDRVLWLLPFDSRDAE